MPLPASSMPKSAPDCLPSGNYIPAAPAPLSPSKSEPCSGVITFRRWSLSFAFRILGTKTPFAAFLGSLLHLTRVGVPAPANALFALPMPYFGAFRNTAALGSRARARIGMRRVTFVSIAALNYVHAGGPTMCRAALRRTPNPTQAKA